MEDEVEIPICDPKPVQPEPSAGMTNAEILFLWDEHRKKGQIQVWIDLDGVLHFKAEEHPGVAFRPALMGDETMGYHV